MPDSEAYRKAVHTRIQDLLAGRRERDPHLSSVGTGRLILEGVVEEIRIYRLHKEEEAREAKDKEQERKEGRGRMGDKERERQRHRPCDRSRERHRHRSRDRDSGRDKKDGRHRDRSRERRKDGGRDGQRDRSRERRRDRSREKHREVSSKKERRRSRERKIPDPVTEGPPDNDPRHMVAGGAGPRGTLPTDDHNQSYRSSTPRHHRPPSPRPVRARISDSPPRRRTDLDGKRPRRDDTRRQRSKSHHHRRRPSPPPPAGRVGPDGTPFGDLPKFKLKKGLALGLGDHFIQTYKHIKAEHEAGHRSKGMFEKKINDMRGKKAGNRDSGIAEQRNKEKGREGDRSGRGDGRRRKDGRGRDDRGRGRDVEEMDERRGKLSSHEGRARDETNQRQVQAAAGEPNGQEPNPDIRIVPPTTVDRSLGQQTPIAPEAPPLVLQPQPPSPTPPRPVQSEWDHMSSPVPKHIPRPPPQTSEEPNIQQESSSPALGEAASYYNPPPENARSPPPPPPGPPPPPPQPPPTAASPLSKPTTSIPTNLLSEIHRGKKLRAVTKSSQNPKPTTSPTSPAYESTPHSHDVEEQEQAQEKSPDPSDRTWSSAESDDESDAPSRSPNRDIRAHLEGLRLLGGGNVAQGRGAHLHLKSNLKSVKRAEMRSVEGNLLIVASRTVENVDGEVMSGGGLDADDGDDDGGMLSELAAHVARPSWDWGNLGK